MKRMRVAVVIAALGAAVWWCGRARAVGWDNDDFIITGAPNFPQYIGVFDHDFTFKGYLDTNFLGLPEEGYALSNGIRAAMAKPEFHQAAFSVGPGDKPIALHIRY